MRQQISENAFIDTHQFQGPTRPANESQRQQRLKKYAGMTVAECREELRRMGAMDPDAARARVWDRLNRQEQRMIAQAAGVVLSRHDAVYVWGDIPERQQERLWTAIRRARTWGQRLHATEQ